MPPILSPHQEVDENGPPANAVITPTGTSDGTNTVRATVSARHCPFRHNAEAGNNRRWSAPTTRRDGVGHDHTDEPNHAAEGHYGPGRGADSRKMNRFDAFGIDAERSCRSSPKARILSTRTRLKSSTSPISKYAANATSTE